MAVPLVRRKVIVTEYHKMIEAGILTEQDRVELINGEIIRMSPIGSKHATNVKQINTLFNRMIGDKAVVSVQDPITLGTQSEPEPDIVLLSPPLEKYWDRHPGAEDIYLVIEVADSSLDYDREIKLPLYASSGIAEVWIINMNAEEIEIHTQPEGDVYTFRQIVRRGGSVSLVQFDLTLPADQLLGPPTAPRP